MVELEIQKIDLDVEGHIRLQCGTERHVKLGFKLLLPSNLDLENDLKRIDKWRAEQLQRENPDKARPLARLTGVRIVAFIEQTFIDGRKMERQIELDRVNETAAQNLD